MISNLDIERRKTRIYQDKNYNIRVSECISKLSECDNKIIKSRKFSRFMQRLLKTYAEGGFGLKIPFFYPQNFPHLVVSKFNSYDLESVLVYDFKNNFLFFKRKFMVGD